MTYMLGKSTKPRPLPTEPVPPGAYKELEDKMLGKSSNTREERIEKIEAECKFTTERTSHLHFLLGEVKKLEAELSDTRQLYYQVISDRNAFHRENAELREASTRQKTLYVLSEDGNEYLIVCELKDQIKALQSKLDGALSNLINLVNTVEKICKASEGMYLIAATHGFKYNGPSFEPAMKDAREALAKIQGEK